jgi:FkbM family methyltransferase
MRPLAGETGSGGRLYVRNIFSSDFVVAHEMFSRDDYGLCRIASVRDNPVILDFGANIGAFTIAAAMRFPEAKIFAYEPEEENFKILSKNIELNKLQNIVIPHQAAIAGHDGVEKLFLSNFEYGHSLLKEFIVEEKTNETEMLSVFCVTVESILETNRIRYVDLIKMDIEGSEYEVLYGLSDELYKCIDRIVLEIHEISGQSREKLKSFLQAKGFRVVQSKTHDRVYFCTKNPNE